MHDSVSRILWGAAFAVTLPVASSLAPSAVSLPASNRFKVILALVSLYLIWGSTYLGIRIAMASGE